MYLKVGLSNHIYNKTIHQDYDLPSFNYADTLDKLIPPLELNALELPQLPYNVRNKWESTLKE